MKWLLLIQLFFCVTALSQRPSLYFEKITEQDGLSHNKVNCILQDQRGFIWLGTDDGLNRYDGKHFIQFHNIPGDTTTLSGNIITDILEDKEGVLWIATADGGMSRYDYRLPPSKKFRQFRHQPGNPASIPVNSINALLEDRHGNLWLGTSGRSLVRFDKKTFAFNYFNPGKKTVLDLCMDRQGLIWVGRQGGGILKIDPVTLATHEDQGYQDLYADLPHVTVTSLFRDKEDHIWFGSWDKKLYRYNIYSGEEEVFSYSGPNSFHDDEIRGFAEDKNGKIWMGGKEKGLHIYDKNSGRFFTFGHDASKEGSVADNSINCIFIDRNDRVLVGTNRGLSINNPQKQQFVQQFLPSSGNLTIYDFFEDANQNTWIGSSEGIYILDAQGSISHKKISYKGIPLHISYFFRDDDGSIYLGTSYSVFRYHPSTNSVSLLPNTEKDGVMNGIIESRIVSIVKDQIDGRPVLLTSPYGHFLSYYDIHKQRWISRLDSLNILERFNIKDNLVRKIITTRSGDLYLATAKEGLAIWKRNPFSELLYLKHDPSDPHSISNNSVTDVVEGKDGKLWVSTYGGGLHIFDPQTRQFKRIPNTHHLVEGLELDDKGNVWMVSNGNLHKYEPAKNTYTSFPLPDLEKTGGVKGGIFKDSRGRFFAGGKNFFIAFDPDSIRSEKTDLKIFLTDFRIFNNSFSHLLQQDQIDIQSRDNNFTFEFSAPEYAPGSKVFYAWKLEGYDESWAEVGERNFVSFSNLAGGNYVFKVRATQTPGSWSDEIASINIRVIPPFWKRPLFFILCALFLLMASYAIYRYRLNELLKTQAIRNKIAQDLHDNVGSTLSSISVYSQVAKIYREQQKNADLDFTLEKIKSASSEMISELNDTVWVINPQNDNMEVVLQRMESFAKPLVAAQGAAFHMKVDPALLKLNLEMDKRKNFFLVFKEAISNAVKYAEALEIRVEIKLKDQKIRMVIEDDGKGFDLSATSEGYKSSDAFGGGNGLRNMQRRSEEMKGRLAITSEPGKGTRLELSFPIT